MRSWQILPSKQAQKGSGHVCLLKGHLVKMASILPPDSGDKPNAPLMWPSEGFTRQDSLDPYQLPVRFSQMNKSKAGPARF